MKGTTLLAVATAMLMANVAHAEYAAMDEIPGGASPGAGPSSSGGGGARRSGGGGGDDAGDPRLRLDGEGFEL